MEVVGEKVKERVEECGVGGGNESRVQWVEGRVRPVAIVLFRPSQSRGGCLLSIANEFPFVSL